ncbi:MAG: hypothetical protein K6E51_06975 [Treponema sp.]|nr:hypothetical protein [Treponema sp.]
MKKTFFLYLIGAAAGLSLLIGCASTSSKTADDYAALYSAMVQANTRTQLLSRHNNYSTNTISIHDTHGTLQTQAYGFDRLYHYVQSDAVYEIQDYSSFGNETTIDEVLYTTTDKYWNIHKADGTEKKIASWYAMTDKEIPDYQESLDFSSPIGDGKDSGEHIVATKDNKNGTMSIVTNAPATSATDIENIPDAWRDATVEYTYLVDTQTLELQKLTVVICTKKERINFIEETVTYDASAPQEYESMRTFAQKDIFKPAEHTRTVTVVYNPGTSAEERFSKTGNTAYGISPIPRKGYKGYKDPAGTIPFNGSDGKSDVIIYALPATSK